MVIGSIEHLPISTRVSRFGRHKRVDIIYLFLSERKTIKYIYFMIHSGKGIHCLEERVIK
ncbi:hypothetical protein ACT46A_002438 [Enterococcus hirae]|uniref:hypothetical protein n=1 Tax=Enterococcus TaxID=1350 RepID=UPI0009BD9445|nr:hypothetical protein [Enterococcus hirae]RXA89315.1 hypothetical protein EQ868_04810 [Enterococcus hirae]